jgi:hypothetical protein
MNAARGLTRPISRPASLSRRALYGVLVAAAAISFGTHANLPDRKQRHAAPGTAFPDVAVSASAPLPRLLSQTGLYEPGSTTVIAVKNLEYTPQYALWSDGAKKRRWIQLPEGSAIDGARPDSWEFPPGTRFWKEFAFGERAETRFIERLADGTYRYASYVWDATLGDAVLAPEEGVPGVAAIADGVRHDIPSVTDCRACHEGRPTPVLGFNALQLSSDRDPLAPHAEAPPANAVDLVELVRRGLLKNFPATLVVHPPRIAARAPAARAAAGYLFGNCAHCHNADGPLAPVGLDFDQSVVDPNGAGHLEANVLGHPSRFIVPGATDSVRAAPGHPEQSAIYARMSSRFPAAQMPPLGTRLVDAEGTRVVAQWISASKSSQTRKETTK